MGEEFGKTPTKKWEGRFRETSTNEGEFWKDSTKWELWKGCSLPTVMSSTPWKCRLSHTDLKMSCSCLAEAEIADRKPMYSVRKDLWVDHSI